MVWDSRSPLGVVGACGMEVLREEDILGVWQPVLNVLPGPGMHIGILGRAREGVE